MKGQIMLITLIMSVFFLGCASADMQNNTTAENITSSKISMTAVEPLGVGVDIAVNPTTLNLGTVYPDGVEREYYSATNVEIKNNAGRLRVYVRASGDLRDVENSSNTIPLSNLKYSIKYDGPYGPIEVQIRNFTTSDFQIWTRVGSVDGIILPVNYYLTVPPYTDPGTYSTEVIYTAV
ncbi:hypothetical protein [Methanothermobacter sp. KEPCO 2]|uniref:hypothetical protein n=1 Tax=Methanothermobacter sp. KEPCO 2 TaxID=3240977 RepID=UPI00351289C9